MMPVSIRVLMAGKLLHSAVASIYILRGLLGIFCLSKRFSMICWWFPFKLLTLCIWDFTQALYEQSLCFLQAFSSPVHKAFEGWPSKPDFFLRGAIFPVKDTPAGEPNIGFGCFTPWGEFCKCNYPPVCGLPIQGGGLDYVSASPTHLTVVRFWYLQL